MFRFDRHLNPLSPAFLTVLLLAGLAVSADRVAAQDNTVLFQLTGNNLRITNQGRGVGICKTSSTDCPNTVTWRWTNANAHTDKRIVIEFIKGTDDAFQCLEEGGSAKVSFQLTSATNSVTATVSSNCPPKSAWIYRVRCEFIANGNECAPPIDPGAIIG